jgi:hypothetical protein
VVDDDILGLDVTMHDAFGVRIMKPLEDLVNIIFGVFGREVRDEELVVGLFDVLEDQAVDLALLHDIQKLYRVMVSLQGHQYFDLPVYLLEFDCMREGILGLSILTTQGWELCRLRERKTSLYLPLPIFCSQT